MIQYLYTLNSIQNVSRSILKPDIRPSFCVQVIKGQRLKYKFRKYRPLYRFHSSVVQLDKSHSTCVSTLKKLDSLNLLHFCLNNYSKRCNNKRSIENSINSLYRDFESSLTLPLHNVSRLNAYNESSRICQKG